MAQSYNKYIKECCKIELSYTLKDMSSPLHQ